jgi:hypothetical protein
MMRDSAASYRHATEPPRARNRPRIASRAVKEASDWAVGMKIASGKTRLLSSEQ